MSFPLNIVQYLLCLLRTNWMRGIKINAPTILVLVKIYKTSIVYTEDLEAYKRERSCQVP